MIDRAIEITDSIKRMQDEKQIVFQEQQNRKTNALLKLKHIDFNNL